MESPGEYLKRERELRGFTVEDVFKATRIQTRHIEALEADQYDRLPHPTFVKGFIKSYCRLLGLDENDAVLRFEVYMRETSEKHEFQRSAHEEAPAAEGDLGGPRLSARTIGILLAAFGVVIIIVFYAVFWRSPSGVEPHPAAEVVEKAETTPPAAAEPGPAEDGAEKKEAPAAITPREAPKEAVTRKTSVKEAAPAAPAGQAAQAAKPPAVKRHTLQVTASDVVWVKVTIDDGESFDVTLKPGEKISWKAASAFVLVVGNAGGVEIVYDGKALPALGTAGEVVRLELSDKNQPSRGAEN